MVASATKRIRFRPEARGVPILYGDTRKSIAQRIFVMVAQSALLGLAYWLLLFGGLERISHVLTREWNRAIDTRRLLLAICFGVVYLRMTVTILFLLKRAMDWNEAVAVPAAFALYYVGFSLFAGSVGSGLGIVEPVGLGLFLAGSIVNSVSEILRDRWKQKPENRGKLYTGGLFRYAVHINYFGDLVWVAGLALITANVWSAVVPVILFCFFALYNGPQLDRYLASKYVADFEEYRKRTKSIIPFVM